MLESKENQFSPKFAHKSGPIVLLYGSVFQNSPKVFKYLGYSCIKIAKSGHTGICVQTFAKGTLRQIVLFKIRIKVSN